MLVPLIVEYTDDGLFVVRNSRPEIVKYPFPPYVLSDTKLSMSNNLVDTIDYATGKKIILSRYDHATQQEAVAHAVFLRKGARAYCIDYVEQLLIDKPDWITQYPQTEPIRFMSFDIEVLTDGGKFPTPDKQPIIIIGYRVSIRSEKSWSHGDIQLLEWDGVTDKDILERFGAVVRDIDPDVMVTYNGKGFDFPYIFSRMNFHGLDTRVFCRLNRKPYAIERMGEKYVGLHGRVVFDLYDAVEKDQSLLGIPNRRMKTVAKHYHLDSVVELETDELKNTAALVGSSKLYDYARSDVEITTQLATIYWPVREVLADMICIPIERAVDGYSSFIPKIVFGRKFKELGITSLENNRARYSHLKLEGKYEAAMVKICRTGRFDKVDKLDFSSQYPSCMVTFNLSPETCMLLGTEPFTSKGYGSSESGAPTWSREGDIIRFRFPDKNYKLDMVIETDLSKKGFTTTMLEELFTERRRLKKSMAEAHDKATELAFESQQNAVKVLMNSIYGYCGQLSSHFGSLPVAIATVQLSKWMILNVSNWLGERVIEIDTDGIYLTDYVPGEAEAHTARLAHLLESSFGVQGRMELGYESYERGFFHKAKNYVLEKKDKVGAVSLVYHGSAFKSGKFSNVYKNALRTLTGRVLAGDSDLYPLYKDLADMCGYSAYDFMMSSRFNKLPGSYRVETSLPAKLAIAFEEHYGRPHEEGDVVEYAVERGGKYVLFDRFSPADVDIDYYTDEVDKVFQLFQLRPKELGQFDLF